MEQILLNWFQKFLNRGSEYYDTDLEKRRAVMFNFIVLLFSITIIPAVIIVSIVNSNTYALVTTSGFYLLTLIGAALNWRGKNQYAVVPLSFCIMAINYVALWKVPTQTGAPYGNLALALACVLLIQNRTLRISLVSLSSMSFLISNFIQLKTKPFDQMEFIPVIMVVILMFLTILYYDRIMHGYQNKIKEQGQQLLTLEKEKHEREMGLKQKDLESSLASFFLKDQITEQFTDKLKTIVKSAQPKRELQRMLVEIQSQNESLKKMTLINQNIDEINSDFYQRLRENYPSLTRGDRELCAYLRLELSNKEIAQLKNTTENTINVAKARLRKKLDLASNKEMSLFLKNF